MIAAAARDCERNDDLLALPQRRLRADLDDFAHEFVAKDIAGLHRRDISVIQMQVGAADRGRGDLDDAVARIDDLGIVDGIDANVDATGVRRRLGVLPDARGVYKRLTARENIAYFGELHGLDAGTIAQRTEALSRALDMGDILDRQTDGFSQGQRTKTAIARALVHDPRNVILDEPTNGLDVMTTRAMRRFLHGLRDEGRCVIFSSHIMQEVAALCDRIVIIANGRVMAEGTPEELRAKAGIDNLEDAFVRLIGSEEGLHA